MPPAERNRWLGELGEALVEAQQLTWKLGVAGNLEAMELYGRIEGALAEVRSLRSSSVSAPRHQDSKWATAVPWSAAEPRR